MLSLIKFSSKMIWTVSCVEFCPSRNCHVLFVRRGTRPRWCEIELGVMLKFRFKVQLWLLYSANPYQDKSSLKSCLQCVRSH
jgi:hypothetical protein